MAMEMQRIWRGRLGRLQFAMERGVRERSAIVIQRVWRMHHPVLGTRAPSSLCERLEAASEVSLFDNNNSVADQWQRKCKGFGVADLVVYNSLWSELLGSAVPW